MSQLPRGWKTGFEPLQQGFLRGSFVKTLNFHNTPHASAEHYERQFAFYRQHFSGVSEADLDAFFATGRWHKPKPGLIPAFFDGYRNNYEVGAKLAEAYGFTGWFFLPSAFMGTPVEAQLAFTERYLINVVHEYEDGRVAMSWDEVRDLARRGHVVASHTQTHSLLTQASPDELLQREIIESKAQLERETGRDVAAFAWLYGSEYGVDPRADDYLRRAGYRYLFSNFKLQKLYS